MCLRGWGWGVRVGGFVGGEGKEGIGLLFVKVDALVRKKMLRRAQLAMKPLLHR